MNLIVHLRLAGALQILLAAMHLGFPRRFHWKEELARLSLLNRQMFLVHTVFVCLVMSMFGALSAFAPGTLVAPSPSPGPLAPLVLGGISFFWLVRLAIQWLVYDPALWRGDAFNKAVHYAFTVLWIYLTAVYGLACFRPAWGG